MYEIIQLGDYSNDLPFQLEKEGNFEIKWFDHKSKVLSVCLKLFSPTLLMNN